ncbi:ABC transporter permease [Nakamurella deserti]|uniref:ABC transporter permease n=1 Tax=Nakamurella deserti TaxID=2164074 RepID=UPI001F0C161D|nr:ABC transporter permease [Nakamurella deserti]
MSDPLFPSTPQAPLMSTGSAGPRAGQTHYLADLEETPLLATDALTKESAPSSLYRDAWKALRRNPIFVVSALLILFILFVVFFPGVLTRNDPRFCELGNSLAPSRSGHLFGFDKQGCDIFSRVVHGARASVTVGVATTAAVVLIGGTFGALAGFYGGWFDAILSRITDIFFAVPLILAAIIFMQMFRGSNTVWQVVAVLAAFGWPQMARITRGAVISVKNGEFVTAATALGVSRFRNLLRHVLPNALPPMIVTATVSLGTYIVAEATLSFLGLGLPGSVMSWGNDISAAQTSLRNAPAVLLYPSAALALTVLSFILLGDAVREALDPTQRKR